MTQKAVLFTLAGQGDREIFLAPPEALAWIAAVRPGTRAVPADVRAALEPFIGELEGCREVLDEEVEVTTGSAGNDVALFLSAVCRQFDRGRDAVAYAAEQGWELAEDEYDGYIY